MSNYGIVTPKKVREQWVAAWGDREAAERVARENPHVRWEEKLGPQVRHFSMLLDLRRQSIHPLSREDHRKLGIPMTLGSGYQEVFPGHRFLMACHWRFQLEAFRESRTGGRSSIKTFQWSFGWQQPGSPRSAMVDMQWAPLYADGTLIGMFACGFVRDATQTTPLRIARPQVTNDGRRCYEVEVSLLRFRARSFRLRQKYLGSLGFTPRELEIVHLMRSGQESCQDLARLLHRSPETIRTHFKHILQKGRKQWHFPFQDTRALVGFMREQALA